MAQQKGDKEVAVIPVPSKDKKPTEPPPLGLKSLAKKKKEDQDELSEENQKLKDEIALLVERLRDPIDGVAQLAVETLSLHLQGATTSMTSVPLPLKFLKPFFADLEKHYEALPSSNQNKAALADVLSIVATVVPNTQRKALQYRLGGRKDTLTTWGQEYLRNISGELAAEYEERQNKLLEQLATSDEPKPQLEASDLLELVFQIVPFYVKHHNEIDAIDLLNEVQKIEAISQYVDASNYHRISQYLMALSDYSTSDEDWPVTLQVTYDIFLKMKEYCQAVRVALKLNDPQRVSKAIAACQDPTIKKQIGYLLATSQKNLADLTADPEDPDLATATNDWLSNMYKLLAKELDVLEPKLPEDIFKSQSDDRRGNNGFLLDSAKMNLASTFVNAFVNAGFGTDKLMTCDEASWIFRNRDIGMLSAAASLGAIMLWNVEEGIQDIDKFRWSNDPTVKAGALLAFGLVCSSTRTSGDYAFGLLGDQVEAETGLERDATILGLGISHAGWQREELLSLLVPLIIDTAVPAETSAFAALSLAMIFLGSANENAAEVILQTLMERQLMPGNLDEPLAYLFAVSLGLLFLSRKDACEATLEVLQTISEHPIGKYAAATLTGFAYAGSGDVTKVQHFLKICIEQPEQDIETKDEDSASASSAAGATESSQKPEGEASSSSSKTSPLFGMHQASAVISMSLIALGEPYGSDMQFRMIDHLLQYGSANLRRAVPLALALLNASNPKPAVIELLSKLTHDSDTDVSLNAVLALGFVGAGTNNARIAELLRQLASSYYSRSLNGLFCVRISQGLLYMGKGLLTISPLISDGFLIAPVSLACLLISLHSCLFLKSTYLGRFHYLLYMLMPAMRPRMLMTVGEDLQPLPVTVRVGQAVDTAGQAGKPRTITGFQTHTTPVLLSAGERAELATNDYAPVSSTPLEGVVILKKLRIRCWNIAHLRKRFIVRDSKKST